MYRQHFGLTQHPFSNEVEPEDLFPAAAAKELEVRLAHLLEMRAVSTRKGLNCFVWFVVSEKRGK